MFTTFLRHIRAHSNAWIVGATIAFCTLVATVLTFLNGNVWLNHMASYSIGITCMSMQMWAHKHRPRTWNREWVTVLAAIVSLITGLLLGGTLGAFDPFYFFRSNATGLVVGGTACLVGCFVILLMGYIRDIEVERDKARQQELAKEHELARAQLSNLQAQIEPHFLFNALANLQSLIESDPKRANKLVEALAQLFRISLNRARSTTGTVDDEVALISNYLEVQRIRLDDRLTFNIEVESGLGHIELAPFLLQPIVENAIKHGIEASPKPGQVDIRIMKKANNIHIDVVNSCDRSVLVQQTNGDGLGLSNVRDRLKIVYGDAAELIVDHSTEDTYRVSMNLPLARMYA